MQGRVNSLLEAELTVRFYGPSGQFLDVNLVVDTGYTGRIVLPEDYIQSLGLRPLNTSFAVLADGSTVRLDTYTAEFDWFGQRLAVVVSSLGSDPLLGMTLMDGFDLRVEIRAGGEVELKPIGTMGVSP